MKRWTAICAALAFVLSSVHAQPTASEDRAQQIDAFMNGLVEQGYAGAVVVALGGQLVLSRGYGLADRAAAVPVTPDTVFDIGSVTKQFTAAAILKLQEQGALQVTDTIDQFFPAVPEDKRGITIHQLLTHTAGFRAGFGGDYEPVLRDQYLARAFARRLVHSPGSTYRYSNTGYSILAAIIELVSGQPYEVYLREQILLPAGMTQTGYLLPDWSEATLAHGYRRRLWRYRDTGTPLDRAFTDDGPYWNLRGNGGLLSTAADMYRWHQALQTDVVLSVASRDLLQTPFADEGGGTSFYSYGWAIAETGRSTTLQTHNGGNGIFFADLHRYVDEDAMLFVTSSSGRCDATQISGDIAVLMFE